MKRKSRKL